MKQTLQILLSTAILALGFAPSATPSSLLVTGIFGGGVQAFDASSGASEGTFAGPPEQGSFQVSGIAVTGSGNVLVANYGDPGIFAYSAAGAPLGRIATAEGIILNMRIGPDGELYVFDQHTNGDAIDEFDSSNGAFIRTAVSTNEFFNAGFDIAPNGNYLIQGFAQLDVFSGATGSQIGAISEGTVSAHILAAPNGDVYYSSLGYSNEPNGIWKCSGCSTGAGTAVQFASYSDGLGGLIFGPDNQLYAAAGDSIIRFDSATGANLGVFASNPAITGGYELAYTSANPTGTPEPATLWMAAPFLCFGVIARRRRRSLL